MDVLLGGVRIGPMESSKYDSLVGEIGALNGPDADADTATGQSWGLATSNASSIFTVTGLMGDDSVLVEDPLSVRNDVPGQLVVDAPDLFRFG